MKKENFAFSKINYLICIASLILILFGFFLMTGPATSIEGGYEPDIFSTKRIVVAPLMSFFGFILMIIGIVYTDKKKETNTPNTAI